MPIPYSVAGRRSFPSDERRKAAAIVEACRAEGLHLKLDLDLLPEEEYDMCAYVARAADGALAGFCTLDSGREMEICGAVHPDHRRRGVGRALLAAALAESRRRGRRRVLLICEEASPAGQALLAAEGAKLTFSEHRMDLTALRRAPAAGPQVRVSRAGAEDAREVAHVIAGAMEDSEAEALAGVQRGLSAPLSRFYIGRAGGVAVGALKVLFIGEKAFIYGFGVLPEQRRRGFGRQILAGVIEALAAEGHTRVALEVESQNVAALSLYRSLGFSVTTTYGYHALDLGDS
jgi:ribosomal protein S18 acetylase RimI-like enzyme